jgi:hypothetical protein
LCAADRALIRRATTLATTSPGAAR